MADDTRSKHWRQTMPGPIGAVTALIVAVRGNSKPHVPQGQPLLTSHAEAAQKSLR